MSRLKCRTFFDSNKYTILYQSVLHVYTIRLSVLNISSGLHLAPGLRHKRHQNSGSKAVKMGGGVRDKAVNVLTKKICFTGDSKFR